jgi:hypothetical protein
VFEKALVVMRVKTLEVAVPAHQVLASEPGAAQQPHPGVAIPDAQATMLTVRDHFASARHAPGAVSLLRNAIDLLSQFCVPAIAACVGMICCDGGHYGRIDLATPTPRPGRPHPAERPG